MKSKKFETPNFFNFKNYEKLSENYFSSSKLYNNFFDSNFQRNKAQSELFNIRCKNSRRKINFSMANASVIHKEPLKVQNRYSQNVIKSKESIHTIFSNLTENNGF